MACRILAIFLGDPARIHSSLTRSLSAAGLLEEQTNAVVEKTYAAYTVERTTIILHVPCDGKGEEIPVERYGRS